MGHFSISDLLVLQAVIGCLLFLDKITKFIALAQQELAKQAAHGGAFLISQFLPGSFQSKSPGLLSSTPEPLQGAASTHFNHSNQNYGGGDFKMRFNGNTLTIELLDGGLCLDVDDDICQENPVHRAVAAALSQSPCAIEKLDLCASFMRADLNFRMIAALLEEMPHLLYLNLGGVSLSVTDLALILRHPLLLELDSITLCDVEFLLADNNHMETDEQQGETMLSQSTTESLALRRFDSLFTRVEQGVTLDPLLETLQYAHCLERFELVMDHNHSYNHGQPRQQGIPANSIFSDHCLTNVLRAARQLRILVLEYVPLTTLHLYAMANSLDPGSSNALKDIRLVDDQTDELIGERDWTAMAHFLKHHSSLHNLSLDGVTRKSKDMSLLLQELVYNSSIDDLRLRNLPIQMDTLRMYLSGNTKLQNLSLHGNTYTKADDEGLLGVVVEVLKEHNSTLQRFSFREGQCARTEIFPRRLKAKSYNFYTHHLSNWTDQRQLHWYLMLNQRGIRHVMVDFGHNAPEFLEVLLNQQDKEGAPGRGDYDLDFVYYLISNNPSICSSATTVH